jgi:transposase
MDLRDLKALEIAARVPLVWRERTCLVPSQSGDARYKVERTLYGYTCTCEDYQLRQRDCKHIIAARLVLQRDGEEKATKLNTDAVPKKPTYKQDWRAYNLAQMTEKKRLQVLLHELCQGIKQPKRAPDKCGRPAAPLADQVFACAYKVYSTFSSRRFNCDLQDAHVAGYLSRPLHPNKINTFLENQRLTPILHSLIVQSSLPLRAVESVFAPDSTGFSTSRFVKWFDEKYGEMKSGRDWVKAHAICGVKTNIVSAVVIGNRDASDTKQFKTLLEITAASGFIIKEVPADKAYLSHENLNLVDGMGGTAFVPFKVNSVAGSGEGVWQRMYHYYGFRREEFLKHYHQRSNIESTFSMLKAKFRDHVRSRTDAAMMNEVLCKFLCHNLCCVIQSQCELGIEATFWPDDRGQEKAGPDVLPMVRPG